MFGISRAGAVWCPVNPRNEAAENRDLLDLFDCTCLMFQARSPRWSPRSAPTCPSSPRWYASTATAGAPRRSSTVDRPEIAEPWQAEPADDLVMIAGTGGTTGRPKGVMLTGHNIETMTALTLMSYPFGARPSTWPSRRSPTRPGCCASRS